ncbi:MAG: 4Fe-4S dicluster domain-containing protein [Candidatus Helarchaeota archaeon]
MSISSAFRNELSESEIGKTINYCYQCGTCSGICPGFRTNTNFNPRKIVEKSLLGFKEELLNDKNIWYCTTCHSCLEVCPQGVLVSEIIFEIKNMAVERGNLPEVHRSESERFATTGMNIPTSAPIQRRRTQFGLPAEIIKPNVEDIKKICEATGFFELIKKKETGAEKNE